MRRSFDVAVLAALLLATPVGAAAQQPAPSAPLTPRAPALQQRATEPAAPLFAIFGLRVAVNAPVARPYCACAFRNSGGQPMRTAGALAEAASVGAP